MSRLGNFIMTAVTGVIGWNLIQGNGIAFLVGIFCVVMSIVGIVRIFKPNIDNE